MACSFALGIKADITPVLHPDQQEFGVPRYSGFASAIEARQVLALDQWLLNGAACNTRQMAIYKWRCLRGSIYAALRALVS
jgi:hypothetical protein